MTKQVYEQKCFSVITKNLRWDGVKLGLSLFKRNCIICWIESTLKMIKNTFYFILLLKCKISEILLFKTACIFLIFLITTMQISMECETQESQAGYIKHFSLH